MYVIYYLFRTVGLKRDASAQSSQLSYRERSNFLDFWWCLFAHLYVHVLGANLRCFALSATHG